jgi:hypothetical protein
LQRTQTRVPERESEVLEEALERLQKNFYHLFRPIRDLRESPDPNDLLTRWYLAEKPSQEWRNFLNYQQAIDVLRVAMGTSRNKTKKLLREYIGQKECG